MIRCVAMFLVALAQGFAADPALFIQASDPQFGMYTADKDFAQETANWTFAVANINRLHPAFLVVTGDLVNKTGDAAQIAEYLRITRGLDRTIPVYNVPGNHDVGNDPTPESIALYRKNFGPDYYSFREGGIYGIVLNSSYFKAPDKVRDEAARQEAWLGAELEKMKQSGAMPVVFLHIPLFPKDADEPDQYFNTPVETRKRILALLHRYNVRYVFAGHLHANSFSKDGDLEMVTTAAEGKPGGPDPSGVQIVEVSGDSLRHRYYLFGALPNAFPVQ
jgi:3',5'-cyclic AMP phosphodiesterase CpdA